LCVVLQHVTDGVKPGRIVDDYRMWEYPSPTYVHRRDSVDTWRLRPTHHITARSDIPLCSGHESAPLSLLKCQDLPSYHLSASSSEYFSSAWSQSTAIKLEGGKELTAIELEGGKELTEIKQGGGKELTAITLEGGEELTAIELEGGDELKVATQTAPSKPVPSSTLVSSEPIMESTPLPSKDIKILHLDMDEKYDMHIYRLEKHWTLRFMLSPSLHGQAVTVFTDHPLTADNTTPLTFRELKWNSESSKPSRDVDMVSADPSEDYSDIDLISAGTFRFRFKLDGIHKLKGAGFFIVNPTLHVGNDRVPLDGLLCQTILSKCLMPNVIDWISQIDVTRECGFNAIHFTPLQELGPYGSNYAIVDQLNVGYLL